MNSKKKIEKYKRFYENGFWTKKMVATLVYDGKLTPEEYEEITGETFTEEEENGIDCYSVDSKINVKTGE